ncbi:hypothetical protein N657DRAFT_639305 [Parathielavia appendiculata]|uniref:Uncharacterized protein n=1 Tax=Parathielavia appendiculata TaxID=2587402 RepID=A0AAN6UA12_9PEZI|nr:hypothetical protein N657DRAFT_639305 [Parathielavia appendiculata]
MSLVRNDNFVAEDRASGTLLLCSDSHKSSRLLFSRLRNWRLIGLQVHRREAEILGLKFPIDSPRSIQPLHGSPSNLGLWLMELAEILLFSGV